MEEKKQNPGQEQPKKMTYEELNKVANELYVANQKMQERMQKMQEALQGQDFQYTAFFMDSLFKVIDHAELYDEKFVEWCIMHIKTALETFVANSEPAQEENKEKDGKSE